MVAKVKLRGDPAVGAIGLYRDPDDNNAPLTDPLNHLEDVILHPALRYCGIIATLSGTLTLPARPGTGVEGMNVAVMNVAAHGQSGRPMILGVIKSHPLAGGADVAWMGSVPIAQRPDEFNPGITDFKLSQLVRWVTLGCNDTHIVCHDVVKRTTGAGTTDPTTVSIAFNYEIHILDVDLESALPSGTETSMSNATGVLEIRTPKGIISMDRRYIRKTASGGLVIPGGKTINTRYQDSGDSNPDTVTWRFWHGSGGIDIGSALTYYPAHNGGPSSWTPRVERVAF